MSSQATHPQPGYSDRNCGAPCDLLQVGLLSMSCSPWSAARTVKTRINTAPEGRFLDQGDDVFETVWLALIVFVMVEAGIYGHMLYRARTGDGRPKQITRTLVEMSDDCAAVVCVRGVPTSRRSRDARPGGDTERGAPQVEVVGHSGGGSSATRVRIRRKTIALPVGTHRHLR